MSNIQDLLRPEMTILIVFCYVLGKSLKESEKVVNHKIPMILLITGAFIGMAYLVILEPGNIPLSMIVGFMQGGIAGFSSTGFNEFKRNTLE